MKVVIYGINGKMGRVLYDEVLKDKDLYFVGGISSKEDKQAAIYKSLDDVEVPDVIIDFSHPSNLLEILEYSIVHKVALVLATTSYTTKDHNMIKDVSLQIPIIYSENYSLGINTILNSIKTYVTTLNNFDIDILEKHHKYKLDALSGTAIKLKKEISKYRDIDIPVHSLRSGNIVGEHSVIFSGEDEVIEINHKINSKKVFALGAIKAAKFITKKNYGLYNIDDLLGDKYE